jgi:hypothetical protein
VAASFLTFVRQVLEMGLFFVLAALAAFAPRVLGQTNMGLANGQTYSQGASSTFFYYYA